MANQVSTSQIVQFKKVTLFVLKILQNFVWNWLRFQSNIDSSNQRSVEKNMNDSLTGAPLCIFTTIDILVAIVNYDYLFFFHSCLEMIENHLPGMNFCQSWEKDVEIIKMKMSMAFSLMKLICQIVNLIEGKTSLNRTLMLLLIIWGNVLVIEKIITHFFQLFFHYKWWTLILKWMDILTYT